MIWASPRQNLSSGFPSKLGSNQSPKLQRLARKLKFACGKFGHNIFNKRITKALIILCGCAGWSAPLLFATPRRQFF